MKNVWVILTLETKILTLQCEMNTYLGTKFWKMTVFLGEGNSL